MKNIHVILFALLIGMSFSYAQETNHHGWEYTHHPDKAGMAYKCRLHSTNIFMQVPAVNYLVHGRMVVYSKEGRRSASIPFFMGKMNGVHLTYDESGEHIVREKSYKNNMLDGFSVEYATNGMILEIQEYKDGKLLSADPSWYIAETNNGGFYIEPMKGSEGVSKGVSQPDPR